MTTRFDSERARAAGKRSAAVRAAKAAEEKVRAGPTWHLDRRWPVPPDILEFTTHADLLNLALSPAQETLLRAIYGLPLTEAQLEIYRQCTGRQDYPGLPFAEVTVIAGARAGKDSRIAAPIVAYEAVFGGHDARLGKGERCMIPIVAQDKEATAVAMGYIRAAFAESKYLRPLVAEELRHSLRLTNRVTIAGFPCTLRSLRGWSIPVGVMDELGFYRLEGSANADGEIQASIRRGMLHFRATRLVKVSTPYLKGGILYDDFTQHWGQESPDILVWRASSVLMNPTITADRLEREQRLDPVRYAREYEAIFTDDLSAFLPQEWIAQAVIPDRHQLPPESGRRYVAACDPSGGGADAFTFSLVHRDDQRVVQDVLMGWKRCAGQQVDLKAVVREIVDTCRRYGVYSIVGDKYAGGWVKQAFNEIGFHYDPVAIPKAQAYLEVLPVFAEGRVDLLDHPEMVRELGILERRTRAGGFDLVDHPRGCHDDYANAACLAIYQATGATRQSLAFTRIYEIGHGGLLVRPGGGRPCSCFNCRHGTGGPCAGQLA